MSTELTALGVLALVALAIYGYRAWLFRRYAKIAEDSLRESLFFIYTVEHGMHELLVRLKRKPEPVDIISYLTEFQGNMRGVQNKICDFYADAFVIANSKFADLTSWRFSTFYGNFISQMDVEVYKHIDRRIRELKLTVNDLKSLKLDQLDKL